MTDLRPIARNANKERRESSVAAGDRGQSSARSWRSCDLEGLCLALADWSGELGCWPAENR